MEPVTSVSGPERTTGRWTRTRWFVAILTAALVLSLTGVLAYRDDLWGTRAEARAAMMALKKGDLAALESRLASFRGDNEFAYYFASSATPRDLGDALATVAGPGRDEPFKRGLDRLEYELSLSDLAGTLALATHGTGTLALPASWTEDFISATTDPAELYGEHGDGIDAGEPTREEQDLANKSNLLLLLSRGYWSTEFLQSLTAAYYDFDRREGAGAWPGASPGAEVGYAPAPNGVYLTDGILALTAALTANPVASEWAFAEFLPGSISVDGSDYTLGKFTHYLMFEHQFPESTGGDRVGLTATLTALSSAIDSASWASGLEHVEPTTSPSDSVGPMHDAVVLRALASDATAASECSWDPRDYGHCVVAAARVVWRWVQHWGHLALDILTLATFAPPPFSAVGVAAAGANATWHAIDGDYAMAGLSLAAAVPGLAFVKIAKSMKSGAAAEKAARQAAAIANATKEIRAGVPVATQRVQLRMRTKEQILANAKKDSSGNYLDANTGKPIPKYQTPDIGHKPGYEHRCMQEWAARAALSRQEFVELMNNPDLFQVEAASSNRSHQFEAKSCASRMP